MQVAARPKTLAKRTTKPFPDIAAVMERSGGRDRSRYANWKTTATERRRDPRLIAYYDFEDLTDSTRRLSNRAAGGGGSELDGGIVGGARYPRQVAGEAIA